MITDKRHNNGPHPGMLMLAGIATIAMTGHFGKDTSSGSQDITHREVDTQRIDKWGEILQGQLLSTKGYLVSPTESHLELAQQLDLSPDKLFAVSPQLDSSTADTLFIAHSNLNLSLANQSSTAPELIVEGQIVTFPQSQSSVFVATSVRTVAEGSR